MGQLFWSTAIRTWTKILYYWDTQRESRSSLAQFDGSIACFNAVDMRYGSAETLPLANRYESDYFPRLAWRTMRDKARNLVSNELPFWTSNRPDLYAKRQGEGFKMPWWPGNNAKAFGPALQNCRPKCETVWTSWKTISRHLQSCKTNPSTGYNGKKSGKHPYLMIKYMVSNVKFPIKKPNEVMFQTMWQGELISRCRELALSDESRSAMSWSLVGASMASSLKASLDFGTKGKRLQSHVLLIALGLNPLNTGTVVEELWVSLAYRLRLMILSHA